jgi:hypothetical protein
MKQATRSMWSDTDCPIAWLSAECAVLCDKYLPLSCLSIVYVSYNDAVSIPERRASNVRMISEQ